MNGHLGPIPVHDLAAAWDPAVLRLPAPAGEVGEILLLVDRGRHEADLVVTPELGAVGEREICLNNMIRIWEMQLPHGRRSNFLIANQET